LWFSILKRKKFNFQLVKETIRRIVKELDGKGINTKDLDEKLISTYTEVVNEMGTKEEKAGLNRLKGKQESLRAYNKLLRNYGYTAKEISANTSDLKTTMWVKE
jgi:hypothetical protein